MNDIAERFKDTTIPAVTIEGYEDGKPIAVNVLVWKIDDILQELAEQSVEPKAPDWNIGDYDKFDWDEHYKRVEAQQNKITAEILGIVWGYMSEEEKKNAYWDEDYEEFVSAEMTAFFAKVRAEEEAEDDRIEAEIEKKGIRAAVALQAECDKANAKVTEMTDES